MCDLTLFEYASLLFISIIVTDIKHLGGNAIKQFILTH
jgi:hypothetical protein